MNKLSRLMLLIPMITLVSCGNEDPKKPASNPSTPASSGTTSGSEVVFYRALTLEEIEASFTELEKTIKEVKSVNIKYSGLENETVDEVTTIKNYALEADIRLFDNSISYSSYTAEKTDDYKKFGFYSEEYGSLVEQYFYIENNFENINNIKVYSKAGEANRKNILTKTPYSISVSDNCFSVGASINLTDPVLHQSEIKFAAVLSNGNYQVRFVQEIDTGTEFHRIAMTYVIQDDYLLSFGYDDETYEIVSAEEKNLLSSYTHLADYFYSSNGDFERSSLPVVNL